MVIVDQDRCAYCGGCVSVCPVQALRLAETRLLVSENCIDCGDCVSACPVGALQSELHDLVSASEPHHRSYDVVVVGAGPGGAMAAFVAAQAGLSVLLLEKRQEIGSPVRCAEGVGHDPLVSLVDLDPRWVAADVTRASITTVTNHETQTLHAAGGRGYVLERRIFDRALAERAACAGAEVRVKTAVTGLLSENGRVCGVCIQRGDFWEGGGRLDVSARVVIAADGVEAQVGRWAGLDTELALCDTMVCIQYLLAGIDVDPTCTSYFIDRTLAPGGYIWIFPKGDEQANVGLGVQADLWQFDRKAAGLVAHLDRFIAQHPGLAQGFPVALVAGNVPVAESPGRLVTDGLVLVGDAARQVDPLTGGGIVNAMAAGEIAANVASQAIAADDTSAAFLRRYEEQWYDLHGRKLLRNYRLRQKFPPDRRTDSRFVHAFALAVGG
jgi:digeranylgeranylglycerophospholipid reductase